MCFPTSHVFRRRMMFSDDVRGRRLRRRLRLASLRSVGLRAPVAVVLRAVESGGAAGGRRRRRRLRRAATRARHRRRGAARARPPLVAQQQHVVRNGLRVGRLRVEDHRRRPRDVGAVRRRPRRGVAGQDDPQLGRLLIRRVRRGALGARQRDALGTSAKGGGGGGGVTRSAVCNFLIEARSRLRCLF